MRRSPSHACSGRRALTLALALLAVVVTPGLVLGAPSGAPAPRAVQAASPLAQRLAAARLARVDQTLSTPGTTTFTVRSAGTLFIHTRGADGGRTPSGVAGGFRAVSGAGIANDAMVPVQRDDILTLVVGARGSNAASPSSGGGGGTAVILRRAGLAPRALLVAGGGAGSGATDTTIPPGLISGRFSGLPVPNVAAAGGGSRGGGGGGGSTFAGESGTGTDAGGGGGSGAGFNDAAGGAGSGAGGRGFGGGGGGGIGAPGGSGATAGGGGGGGGYVGGDGGAAGVNGTGGLSYRASEVTGGSEGFNVQSGSDRDGEITLSGPPTEVAPAPRVTFTGSANGMPTSTYSYTVPATGALTVSARGGLGGSTNTGNAYGGTGAVVQATFTAQQGDVLLVVVGLVGSGRAGAGGTAVVLTRDNVQTLLLVGGGGGGSSRGNPGAGGISADGTPVGGSANAGTASGGGGFNAPGMTGGTGSAGGGAGTLSAGGAGGASVTSGGGGAGFGGGGGAARNGNSFGGGGGGGYGGGAGGSIANEAGGSGGTSFVLTTGALAGTSVVRTDGAVGSRDGAKPNGEVVLTGPATVATVTQNGLYNPAVAPDAGAAYRLLGAPVPNYTVTDLARLNLVQGVGPGNDAAAYPAQYPLAAANIFTRYNGTGPGGYGAAPSAGTPLELGRGFFWYLYDRDIPAGAGFGGGTSASRELTGFALTATAVPAEENIQVVFADNTGAGTDDFQMLANPFARPFAVAGITAFGGTVQGGIVQAYDPSVPGYVTLGVAGDATPDVLATWQGAFAELVPTFVGQPITVIYALRSTQAAGTPFYGRSASDDVPPTVFVTLEGTLASGAHVGDRAAVVRFLPDASAGWDAFDASKLMPPTADIGLVAPTISRDGEAYRLAVDSRPLGAQARVPLSFTATAAGRFRLSWTLAGGPEGLPGGWTATLADTQTGETVDMTRVSELPFTAAEAQDWTERFVLTVTPTGATAAAETPALALGLSAPAPNPAAQRSALTLTLPEPQRVRAVVIDALGREVAILLDAEAAGAVRLDVDTARLAPGVYTVRASGASFALTRRLTVVR